ncbi:MAG TPA: 4Fe-4S dicluster domain-containing protein [Syntrophomonadaceae bacterium]|nr:4Fe-4S dicluster domain-containing protein [Syntrophomonadaceae bacterium]
MKILKTAKLETVFDRLADALELYVPMVRGPQSGFYSWKTYDEDYDDLMLDILNVYQPPKDIILPQTEKLYDFKQDGTEINLEEANEKVEKKAIFGVRACDVRSFDYLDKVFLTKGYVDEAYKARRDSVTIIANACYNPGTNCFCDSMGVSPTEIESADVTLREYGPEGYVWEVNSPKGEEITKLIADLLEDDEVQLPELKPFIRRINYEGVPEKLKDMFDHPMWDRASATCENCGICTYLCPTCYCFDIQVKSWGDEGYRFRCWDSCMYREYSEMAGGNNPRELAKERFRNRFLHKLQFFNERYGTPLCTGCGRCIVVCPSGINIVNIIQDIKEAETGA